jgi:hypothetical protein
MSRLPSHDHLSLYGPALTRDGLIACLERIWQACGSSVKEISSPYGIAAADVPSFIAALERSGRPVDAAIGCALKGGGREVLVASSRRDIARSLDAGPQFQQTIISFSFTRDREIGPRLLAAAGEASGAWFGSYTPEPEDTLLMLKRGAFLKDVRWKEAGARYDGLRHSTQLSERSVINLEHWSQARLPFQFGWCNYWSAETCKLLGFPDVNRDAQLMARSSKLSNSAWIVQITESRFDLRLDEHISALIELERRFAICGKPI